MPLDEYQQKRDFSRTPEPGARRFVVHEHHASRLHYDLRLELDGVLLSWAVPKGPSLDPADKRLAVRTEDHPLEYLTFEGVIPEGAYGAGTVSIWDQGTWDPDDDPRVGLDRGHLTFRLRGERLTGGFRLVRTTRDWLLMKRRDPDAPALELPDAPEAPLPPRLELRRPRLADRAPEGDWLAELRLDGDRRLGRRDGARVSLLDDEGHDHAAGAPGISRAVAALRADGLILDGVVVGATYVVFDLLHAEGHDLTGVPLERRKQSLKALIDASPPSDALRYLGHVSGRGPDFLEEACKLGVSGAVFKRGDDWREVRCARGISSPDKVLWPGTGLTKRDLARAYEALAERMLPGVVDRWLTLVRCPEGVDGGCFFQKHDRGGAPLSVQDRAGLVGLAQLGVLEVHVPGVRIGDPGRPDRLVLDLDPGEGVPWARVAATALALREVLEAMGLVPLVRATGGKGLHVVAPLVPRASLDEVKEAAHAIARRFARRDPDHYTAKPSRAHRRGRIYVDWVRNAREATAIATWSPRARPGAPVAVPLAWSELDPGAGGPPIVSLREAVERADPWPDLAAVARPLSGRPAAPRGCP